MKTNMRPSAATLHSNPIQDFDDDN